LSYATTDKIEGVEERDGHRGFAWLSSWYPAGKYFVKIIRRIFSIEFVMGREGVASAERELIRYILKMADSVFHVSHRPLSASPVNKQ
jgi:hypothetical protein